MTSSIGQTLHQLLTLLLIRGHSRRKEFDTIKLAQQHYLIVRSFNRAFATGVACQQKKLTHLHTWSCPLLGLSCVLILRPISLELVLFPEFWVSNIPRYFCFACIIAMLLFYRLHIIVCDASIHIRTWMSKYPLSSIKEQDKSYEID